MELKDFEVFRVLLSDVYVKAFGEPLSSLPLGKALALALLIEEATGVALSYKSLKNYINAILAGKPGSVNPSSSTLAILACFVTGEQDRRQLSAAWYRYRADVLAEA